MICLFLCFGFFFSFLFFGSFFYWGVELVGSIWIKTTSERALSAKTPSVVICIEMMLPDSLLQWMDATEISSASHKRCLYNYTQRFRYLLVITACLQSELKATLTVSTFWDFSTACSFNFEWHIRSKIKLIISSVVSWDVESELNGPHWLFED